MNPILRNILAVVAGLICGALINSGIISISGSIIPPPKGADFTTEEGLINSMHLMQPKHFIMPFLAHALGSLFGAFVVAKLAVNNKMTLGLVIGILFLIGGAMMVFILPSPLWFNLLDLIVAYLPMAYLGVKLGNRN